MKPTWWKAHAKLLAHFGQAKCASLAAEAAIGFTDEDYHTEVYMHANQDDVPIRAAKDGTHCAIPVIAPDGTFGIWLMPPKRHKEITEGQHRSKGP